jgi:tRNA A-37 threonylcarbamoyl transferase component Bud32
MGRLSDFDSVDHAFKAVGTIMRAHTGRSVTRVEVDGRPHYLKRYWWSPSQAFLGHVRRGRHELAMIDWLNESGFAGPRVVSRGLQTRMGVMWRFFFLMDEVPGETTLEDAWWRSPDTCMEMAERLVVFAARLHDAGFVHTDFSERHIFVANQNGEWRFRLIDVERARANVRDERLFAADLRTLHASIADQRFREWVAGPFLDRYVAHRTTLERGTDMRLLFDRAQPTRNFVL